MWCVGLVCALAMAACDATPRTTAQTSPESTEGSASLAPVTTSTCPPTAQLDGNGGLPERQGAGTGATLWALFFPREPVLTAGTEIKVVWRMTGSGSLSISAYGPDGMVVEPVWGPESHGGSTWNRPGEEWGTGWVFPAAGCWTISATRTSGSGYLVVRVGEQAT